MPTSSPHPDENTVEGNVTIQRPVEEVFAFYEHFNNLPRFLGDVMAVVQIAPATFRWTIQGPFGFRVKTTIKISEIRRNKLIRYETAGVAGLRGSWEIYFAPGPEVHETEVREVMRIPLGRLGRAALRLIGKSPLDEVSSNLHRLKEVIETGKVTDTSYSVAKPSITWPKGKSNP
jgi:uncharacterized membrane protein